MRIFNKWWELLPTMYFAFYMGFYDMSWIHFGAWIVPFCCILLYSYHKIEKELAR